MSKQELLKELFSLPIDERLEISDKLNQTLNPISAETEKAWLDEIDRRKEEYKSGEIETISYKEFFGEN